MKRGGALLALSTALLAGGCTTLVEPQDALNGQPLETAVALFGRYQERVVIDGRSFYLWRRVVDVEGKPYGCELRVELGYREVIRETILEGFPTACSAFSVQYTSDPNLARKKADETEPKPRSD